MKTNRSNCVGCIFQVPVLMGAICGWSPLSLACPHTKSPSIRAKCSPLRRVLSALVLTPLLVYLGVTVLGLLQADRTSTRYLLVVFDGLMVFTCLAAGVGGVAKVGQRVEELNGLGALVSNRRFYGVERLVEDRLVKMIVMLTRAGLPGVSVGLGYMSYLVYIQKKHHKYDSAFMRTYNLTFCLYLQAVVCIQFLLSNYVYEVLFRSCFAAVKKSLTHKASRCELPLHIKLKRLQRLYQGLLLCYKQLNKFYNPCFLICWVCLIAMIIISLIMDLIHRRSGVSDAPVFVVYSIGTAGVVIYLISCQRINVVTDDILCFLFKYPVSRLCPREVAQVRMLIKVLTIQKPTLTASGVFKVGSPLLASICSAIITYVLVAFEFHELVTKKEENRHLLV